jgi:hypothetical protein
VVRNWTILFLRSYAKSEEHIFLVHVPLPLTCMHFNLTFAIPSTLITSEDVDTKRHLFLALAFSSTTPIGVLLGLVLLRDFDGDSAAVGVVQAMVAGTFLYVAIVEVGMKELLVCRHGEADLNLNLGKQQRDSVSIKQLEFLKLSFFLFGFLAMSALAIYV